MADILKKIKALGEAVAATGKDLNIQTSGEGYEPPAAGPTRLRFVSYVELGVHTKKSKLYGDKTKPMARFTFELSGPLHPAKEIEGKKYPHLISFEEPIGTGAKNNYSKLFKLMAAEYPDVKNFVQLLGKAFRGTVFHREYKVGDQTRIAAELKSKESGYSIKGLNYVDEETGQPKVAKVDAPLGDIQAFVWDEGDDLDFWDSLYIAGQYDDGGTKNKIQEKIKRAENFVGSPVYTALVEAGREEETVPFQGGAGPAEQEADEEDEAPAQEGGKKAPETAQETTSQAAKGVGAGKAKNAPAAQPSSGNKAVAVKQQKVKEPEPEPEGEDDGDPLAGL